MNLSPQLSLVELQQAFSEWRQTRQPRYVPDELRKQALGLLSQHSRTELTRALGINYSMLIRWKRQYEATETAAAGFVSLPVNGAEKPERVSAPLESVPLRLTIRREAETLTLSGELSLAQWRSALSLLETGQ